MDPIPPAKEAAGELPRPGTLKEEDLRPGHEAPSPGASDALRPIGRPEESAPRAVVKPPSREETTGITPGAEEKPAAAAEPPMPEPTAKGPEALIPGPATDPKPAPSAPEPAVAVPSPARGPAEGGWVRIPNKGRIPSGLDDASARRGPEPAFDHRGRPDTEPAFEPASPAGPPAAAKGRTVAGPSLTGLAAVPRVLRPAAGSRAAGASARVEPSLHIVERGENFWTISRLYYGSGRYYRALWMANVQKYPNIDELHINDVLRIPAVEDLDPSYVERPNRRPIAERDTGPAGGPDAVAAAGLRAGSAPTTRTARPSDDEGGLPARRAVGASPHLELPVGDADPVPVPERRGRVASADRPAAGDTEGATTAVRSTARPRNIAALDRPVYKVRRHDTLRSIARDVLGDARRADELYDINRDIIEDPSHLVAGQLLDLPEDADTRRVTVRDRSGGRD